MLDAAPAALACCAPPAALMALTDPCTLMDVLPTPGRFTVAFWAAPRAAW